MLNEAWSRLCSMSFCAMHGPAIFCLTHRYIHCTVMYVHPGLCLPINSQGNESTSVYTLGLSAYSADRYVRCAWCQTIETSFNKESRDYISLWEVSPSLLIHPHWTTPCMPIYSPTRKQSQGSLRLYSWPTLDILHELHAIPTALHIVSRWLHGGLHAEIYIMAICNSSCAVHACMV